MKIIQKIGKFLIAPALSCFGIFIIYIVTGETFWQLFSLMSIYFFPPLGKESVLLMGIGLNYHPIVMTIVISFCDIMVALFLMHNYDLIKYIPLLGKWVTKIENKGHKVIENKPWLQKFQFIGLVLFVSFPLQGSGGVGTTILGRLMGVNKYIVFIAISIGSVLGCLLIAYTGHLIKQIIIENLIIGLSIIGIIITTVIIYYWRKRNESKTD